MYLSSGLFRNALFFSPIEVGVEVFSLYERWVVELIPVWHLPVDDAVRLHFVAIEKVDILVEVIRPVVV